MLKNVTDLAAPDYSKGLNTITNILAVGKNQTPNIMNVSVNFDGGLQKRAGSVTNNAVTIANSGDAAFTINTNLTLNTGLQAFWQMNEPSGTRYASFGTLNLADNNSVPSAPGIRAQAASFTASNRQYLFHENVGALTPGDADFSISTWLYLNATSRILQQMLISKMDSSIRAVGLGNTAGFVSGYLLNDSGRTTEDIKGVNTLAISGNILQVTGVFGGAHEFQTGGDLWFIGDNSQSGLDITGDLTICGWARVNSFVGGQYIFAGKGNDAYSLMFNNFGRMFFVAGAVIATTAATAVTTNTGTHIAVVFNSAAQTVTYYVNGVSDAPITGFTGVPANNSASFHIAAGNNNYNAFGIQGSGNFIDDFAIFNRTLSSNEIALIKSNGVSAYFGIAQSASQAEYRLFVDTDNIAVFEVSSSGLYGNGSARATSFGTLSTGTWYNIIGMHDSVNDTVGISVNLSANSGAYTAGVKSGSGPFVVGAMSNGVGGFLTGRIDDTGFWTKVLTTAERNNLYNGGSGNTYSLGFNQQPWASFDFGAQATRWLTVAIGTGIAASSDLGVNWVTIATDRSATYQYFERSKNVLIATSDLYDVPLAWPGSAGTFMFRMNSNAPLAKYTVNFQGFCILLNTATRKRGFFYQDENTQLTGTWANSFDLPSSADDEITAAFVLRRYLYISTRYSLFRVSFVGGNPDWSFQLIKNFGFVPRTVGKITLGQVGEVAIGEDWDRRVRVFDGADDKIISTDVEDDNGMCDFATSKVSYGGSGLITHFAAIDPTAYVYKLAVGIGTNSTDVTHWLNFDARTSAFFPYSNMLFSTMTVAESGFQRYLMAFDKSGYVHLMDSGNLDGGVTPIDEVFDSPFLFDKSPSRISKGHKIDLFFVPHSSGTIHYYDRTNFSTVFDHKHKFGLTGTSNEILTKVSVDTPTSYNAYQFRLSSSASTAEGWELIRNDNFVFGLGIGGFQR